MKYLFVVAHPDDEVLGAGGMIYNLVKNNNDVYVCYLCGESEARKIKSKDKTIKEQAVECLNFLDKILYLIFDYPHKHYTFKHFEV